MAVAESREFLSRQSKAHGWFRGLFLVTAVSVFVLVVLGGVVRVTGSGLGCPDWPLCHGSIFPPLRLEGIIEYTHRLVTSAIVGPLVVATSVVAWLAYRQEPWLAVPATIGVVLLLGQAVLGGVTVLNELSPGIVAGHLVLGEALLACMILVVVVGFRGPLTLQSAGQEHGKTDRFPAMALASAVGLYLLMLTGAYVTASGATGACTSWPLCHGSVFPSARLPMIHMTHRLVAAVIGAFLMYTLHLGFRGRQRPAPVRSLSMAAAALFLAQVMVGAATIWLGFPRSFIALHLSMATAVWTAVVAMVALSFAPRRAPSGVMSRG